MAFGATMVRRGRLPALAWAGHCCWAVGRPLPLWCCCGGRGLSSDQCNGHPTHREPTRGRLWVVGGVGPRTMLAGAVMRGCWHPPVPQCRPLVQQQAHLGANLWHSQAQNMAPQHPQPKGDLCRAPCGLGAHCSGQEVPQWRHNGPRTARNRPRPFCPRPLSSFFGGLLENTNGRAWTPCFVSCLGLLVPMGRAPCVF